MEAEFCYLRVIEILSNMKKCYLRVFPPPGHVFCEKKEFTTREKGPGGPKMQVVNDAARETEFTTRENGPGGPKMQVVNKTSAD